MKLDLEANLPRQWSPIATMPVSTYSAPFLAYKNELILILGGGSPASSSDQILAYNVASDSWNAGYAVMPERRTAHCAVIQGQDVWVIGGKRPE